MTVRWKKSNRSVSDGSCVEVANHFDAVRDSKNPSVVLGVSPARLKAFVNALKAR